MFDQFYQQSSEHLKLAFLDETFQKYPNLKEDFLAFYLKPSDSPLKMTVGDPDDFIIANTDLIKADLESIEINEPDWEDYVPRHSGYIPEYEAMENLAEDQISRMLGLHVSEVERYCTIKHFDLAFLYIISLYHACIEAELDDEYETLPHASNTMLNLLENQLQERDALFKVIQLSPDQLFTIATVIFDQFQKYFREDSMFLKFFEPLLFDVIHSGAGASILLDAIENQKATEHVPWLVSELHRKTGGQAVWEQSARQLCKKNISVAQSLLEYYGRENKAEFVHIARELWFNGLFQAEFAHLYFEGLEPAEDPELYLAVAFYLNKRQFSEASYRVLLELMGKEERLDYIESFKWNRSAYVQALCMEEKYTEALRFAGQHIDRWNIVDVMTPCLHFQPVSALDLLERKIEELLVDERGRNFYERIAEVLKIAAEIPAIKENTEKLAIRIYSFYSRLSALRDELRIAGLVKI